MNRLFIGSQTGMFIYNLSNPDNPVQDGQFNHVRSCDPVIADEKYAYVTLRSGSCQRCVEACPTEAILPNKVVNGSKCISYFTIELKDEIIPEEMKGKFQNWMFGCDICQDVCPWNRFSKPHNDTQFAPIPELLNLSTKEWEELSEEMFKKIFKHSPLSRAKHKGIKRNIKFLKA